VLIIAMPKSASTSLARTIARTHGLAEYNGDINAENPPQFPAAHRLAQELHPYPAVPAETLREIVTDRTALRKLHLFPTGPVLEAIADQPVVVLLRDPAEVVDAEFRAFIAGIHPLAPSMPRTASLGRWRAAAAAGGLLASLQSFAEEWRAVAAARPQEMLLIEHLEVVRDPTRVLAACERHLGLPPSSGLELLRERWSGVDPSLHSRSGSWAHGWATVRIAARRGARGARRRLERAIRRQKRRLRVLARRIGGSGS
jgi:hypothetical protein